MISCKVPFSDMYIIMNVYKVYNLPILHPALKKAFCYSVEGEYHTPSSDGHYVTITLEYYRITCVLTEGQMPI